MKFDDVILTRRSIRKFIDKEVEDSKIEKILNYALSSPTAKSSKPWTFFVIKNVDLINEIKQVDYRFQYNSKVLIITAGDSNKFLPSPREQLWVQDLSAVTYNMLLTARSVNLGSVWCSIYPRDEFVTKIRDILKLSNNIIPFSIVQIGYTDLEFKTVDRTDSSIVKVYN